jgi:hypothetical protein
MAQRGDPGLVGMELNSSRVRAVRGPAGGEPNPLALAGDELELPLALSLEGRTPEVGRAGLALSRRAPHLACLDFLAHLGTPRQWHANRHRLDAEQALSLVLQHLRPACARSRGVVLALPAYLAPGQVSLLTAAAEQAGWPVLGTVTAPLAAALAAHAEQAWTGTALVIDVDDHALTLSTVQVGGDQLLVPDTRILPRFNLRAWKERLLAAVADRCIRQSRRDPRDSAATEQTLYDDLEHVLDGCREGRPVELAIQTPRWYQNLILPPEDIVTFCTPLVRPVVDALEALLAGNKPEAGPLLVLLTAAAGRLPGLAAAVQQCLDDLTPGGEEDASTRGDEEEPPADAVREVPVATDLAADAAARGAQALAAHFLREALPPEHLDLRAPIPERRAVDAGPPRLRFGGRDYVLDGPTFTLGRQPTCDLVFDSDAYPAVSGRHCDIVFERRTYILRDRSRYGTLVNERPVNQQVALCPGDWIRLGTDGPVLRFLGQAAGPRRLMPTA